MRSAYLILAHRAPAQLARLVAALKLPPAARFAGDKAFIHIDKRIDIKPYRAALHGAGLCETVDFELVAKRVAAAWGDFSLVQATLNLIDASRRDGAEYDYLSLLSGQDYPLTGASERERRLSKSPNAEHLSWFSLPHDGWALNGGLNRIRRYHNPGLRERIRTSGLPAARYLGAALALGLSLFPRPRGVPDNLIVYGGWQWWTLTAACASYVLDYADRNLGLVRFFRYSYIPDELFFQTIIMNSPFAEKVTGNYLRFVEWDGIKPHVFDSSDVSALLSAGKDRLFARKFDAGSDGASALLDELDLVADEWRGDAFTTKMTSAGQQST